MAFCKEYNAATQDKVGTVIPVEITVFEVSNLNLISACVLHAVVPCYVLTMTHPTNIKLHPGAWIVVACTCLLSQQVTE